MGDIFREIDEELRQERYEKLWRRYGKYMIGAAIIFVLAVAGYQIWRQYDRSQREAESARFASAVTAMEQGRSADAQAMFSALARDTSSGYGTLARLHEAALRASSGDRDGAISVYDQLAADTSADKPLRELATILAALHRLGDDKADLAAIRAGLEPLAAANAAWRFSALELLGLIAQREGKTAAAKKHFQAIVDDPKAPRGARTRASQLLAIMEG